MGFQAHPEFCTRPLNPSPPFLGFVSASAGPKVLEEQIKQQMETYVPPHPEDSMISEEELKRIQSASSDGEHLVDGGSGDSS